MRRFDTDIAAYLPQFPNGTLILNYGTTHHIVNFLRELARVEERLHKFDAKPTQRETVDWYNGGWIRNPSAPCRFHPPFPGRQIIAPFTERLRIGSLSRHIVLDPMPVQVREEAVHHVCAVGEPGE